MFSSFRMTPSLLRGMSVLSLIIMLRFISTSYMRLPWGEAFPHRPALSTTQVSSVFKRVHMSTMSSSSASKRPEITRGQSFLAQETNSLDSVFSWSIASGRSIEGCDSY
ncbi:uncharacterized protein [Physcomitrium patens]|uniref:uncharacterized protein isoform X2 n=1 Tax=Physcomitrium patens TaxID=3218 RepID=UPI000D17CE30|nr:uncharacterized protein LOC112292601 isoform X2 [Physcomitrium patens]|eukprot:XP_024397024.1 uncharacterized protein LOC112292601 isoform X2 [Physcomitrella patens]